MSTHSNNEPEYYGTARKVSRNHGPGDLTYNRTASGRNEWVRVEEYLPRDFDLCMVKLKGKIREYSAWCVGNRWYGLRLEHGDKVTQWKRTKEHATQAREG